MKKQNQQDNVVKFLSVTTKLAAIKAAEIERSQIYELLNPTAECPHCQLQTEISICIELASARTQILSDSCFNLTDEEYEAILEERESYILMAYQAVIKLHEVQETH